MKKFSWDEYFITIAYAVSMKSKDPSTKVGCVVIGDDNEILSTGYNGFPRGVDDNKIDRYKGIDKYKWIACAERNAIYNAARNGTKLEGSTVYTNLLPCAECSKAMVQTGIKELIYHKNFTDTYKKYSIDSEVTFTISEAILKEGGIKVIEFTGDIIDLVGLTKGNTFEL